MEGVIKGDHVSSRRLPPPHFGGLIIIFFQVLRGRESEKGSMYLSNMKYN